MLRRLRRTALKWPTGPGDARSDPLPDDFWLVESETTSRGRRSADGSIYSGIGFFVIWFADFFLKCIVGLFLVLKYSSYVAYITVT